MTPASRLAAPLVATALAHGAVTAGEWDVTPRIGVRQIYSDNIAILPRGREQHDWVTEISPGFDVRGAGRRLQADIFYTGQGVIYARFDDNSDLFHRLQANATAEVLEEFLFVDGDWSGCRSTRSRARRRRRIADRRDSDRCPAPC